MSLSFLWNFKYEWSIENWHNILCGRHEGKVICAFRQPEQSKLCQKAYYIPTADKLKLNILNWSYTKPGYTHLQKMKEAFRLLNIHPTRLEQVPRSTGNWILDKRITEGAYFIDEVRGLFTEEEYTKLQEICNAEWDLSGVKTEGDCMDEQAHCEWEKATLGEPIFRGH